MTKSREEFLHRKSLILGKMFREAYERCGKDHQITKDLLERYCNTRRELPGEGNDGQRQSTRLGAYEAFQSTQEG
jgi:hypothetical protein